MDKPVTYEEAVKLLRLMRVSAYKERERQVIDWIQEVLWRDNDMRNS